VLYKYNCKKAASAAQLANCFYFVLIIYVQPRLPAARAQTKTSLNLFNVLA